MKKLRLQTTDYAVIGALALGAFWWWKKGQPVAQAAPIAQMSAPPVQGPVAQILNTNTGVPVSATNTPVPDIGNGFDPSNSGGDSNNSAANAVILGGG